MPVSELLPLWFNIDYYNKEISRQCHTTLILCVLLIFVKYAFLPIIEMTSLNRSAYVTPTMAYSRKQQFWHLQVISGFYCMYIVSLRIVI